MNAKLALPITMVLALSAGVMAQGRITPQSIIVNPVQTDLKVDVTLSKNGDNPAYTIGQPITVSVSVNQDAYVYLFSVKASGGVDLILPNRFSGGENFLKAGETRTFPPQGAKFSFTVDGPAGQEKVLAVASRNKLDIDQIATFKGAKPLAETNVQVRTQENLARALSIVVEPVPAADWVTSVASYRVVAPAPTTGTLLINNLPVGATVFFDNATVGQVGTTFTLTPGKHSVRIVLEGYRPFTGTVTVGAGKTSTFQPQLVVVPLEGSVTVRSGAVGALVFVDGQQVGKIGADGTLSLKKLPAGDHELVVVATGGRSVVGTFTVTAGQTVSVDARR